MIGRVLQDRYEIVFLLGSGGFGNAYLSVLLEPSFDNPLIWLVVKQLNPIINPLTNLTLEEVRNRFIDEVVALDVLGRHRNIPRLIDFFEDNEQFYLVQEYIDGHELSHELGLHAFTNKEVYDFLVDILQTLEYIHNKHIIHRDLTPDNIIRRRLDHGLSIIDFGAIKRAFIGIDNQLRFSKTIAIGKENYMPDEQVSGRPQFCSDIYAIGIVATQALLGFLPGKDYNTGELHWQHHLGSVSYITRILERMTYYQHTERFQSAQEVLDELNLQEVLDELNLTNQYLSDSGDSSSRYFNYPKVWYERGNRLKNLGYHRQASFLYRKATECDARYFQAWFNLGITHIYLQNYQDAREYLLKADSIRQNLEKVQFHIGICSYHLMDYPEAIDRFERTLTINPYHYRSCMYNGLSYYRINQNEQALLYCQRAIEMSPRILSIIPSNHKEMLTEIGLC